jgi:hypothetical protein
MTKNWSEAVLKSLLHAGTFLVVYWVVTWLASHSPSRVGYGWISGWWACLYIGYVASIGLLPGLIVAVGYIALGILAVYGQWHWFYGGLPERLDIEFLIYPLVAGAAIYASPVAVNAMARFVLSRWRRGGAGRFAE